MDTSFTESLHGPQARQAENQNLIGKQLVTAPSRGNSATGQTVSVNHTTNLQHHIILFFFLFFFVIGLLAQHGFVGRQFAKFGEFVHTQALSIVRSSFDIWISRKCEQDNSGYRKTRVCFFSFPFVFFLNYLSLNGFFVWRRDRQPIKLTKVHFINTSQSIHQYQS